MRVWDLDCDDNDNCDVKVYLPGPPGPPLMSVGSMTAPVDVSAGTVPAPVSRWQRTFISGVENAVPTLTLTNPPDNGDWLLGLQVVGPNGVNLDNASNVKLSGAAPMIADSIIWVLWDKVSRWVESGRNEIF